MDLQARTLYEAISGALRDSRDWVGQRRKRNHEVSNSLKSSMFCTKVGERLDTHVGTDATRRQIVVTESGKREPGEWLLDIVWTEDEARTVRGSSSSMPRRIRCALECESSTNGQEFFKDFAKLLNIRSRTKIFLGGLTQGKLITAKSYMDRRLAEAARYIRECEGNCKDTDWYIGFWPSPKGGQKTSLWDSLDQPTHSHLAIAYVFQYDQNAASFVPYIAQEPGFDK
jgi:hypothetical protein